MFRVLIVGAICASTACAGTIIGDLGAGVPGHVAGWKMTGQTFTVPTPDNVLTAWEFSVAGWQQFRGFTDTIEIAIYDWTGSLTPPLSAYYFTDIAWPATTGVVSLSGLNVPLVSGQTYVTVYFTGDYADNAIGYYGTDHYAGGQLLIGQDFGQLGTTALSWTNFDSDFSATFAGSATADAPEPSTAALLVLFGASCGAWSMIRRLCATIR